MMGNVIHIFGASGSGTSTLGYALAESLGYKLMDSDDYFWLPTNPRFTEKRPQAERIALMKADIDRHENVVISGALVGWGDELIPCFTLAIRLETPAELRIERLRKREHERFGKRIEQGGDMHEQHLQFIEWAGKYDSGGTEMRSKAQHDQWQKRLPCDVLHLRGDNPTSRNIEIIMNKIK
ncbi:MAG: AAA family ATPase [Clostridia bacterium]|nr:AAA family ATPase [Clostridia bacterium]